MKATSAYSQGFSLLLRQRKVWVLFYLFNIFVSLLFIAPVALFLDNLLSKNLYGERLLRNFDVQWVLEVIHNYPKLPAFILVNGLVIIALYMLFHAVFLSGAINLFHTKERYTFAGFLRGVAIYFPRFLRFYILSLILYGLFFGAMGFLINKFQFLIKDSIEQTPVLWFNWCKAGILLLGLSILQLLFDITRVSLVVDNQTKTMKALWKNVKFFVKTPGPFVFLFSIFLGVMGIVFALQALIFNSFPKSSILLAFIFFLFQQCFILAKIGYRLHFYASLTLLYQKK